MATRRQRRSDGDGDGDGAFLQMLGRGIEVQRQLENENIPADRMAMSIGHLETPTGDVPWIVQRPHPLVMHVRTDAERASFSRFGHEMACPRRHAEVVQTLSGMVTGSLVCLENAFVNIRLVLGECAVTIGTRGSPGWTNRNSFPSSAFDYLASMSEAGGVLVDFLELFERNREPPEPESEPTLSWHAIRRSNVGKRALEMMKRPRDRLILLLAAHEMMTPAEINKLNLCQVRQRLGRDCKLRVYLKRKLVRRKAVADALLAFRQRARDCCWDDEPMFRVNETTRTGRSKRMGPKAIEALILRHVERATKDMPTDEGKPAKAAITPLPAPPVFWVYDVTFDGAATKGRNKAITGAAKRHGDRRARK